MYAPFVLFLRCGGDLEQGMTGKAEPRATARAAALPH